MVPSIPFPTSFPLELGLRGGIILLLATFFCLVLDNNSRVSHQKAHLFVWKKVDMTIWRASATSLNALVPLQIEIVIESGLTLGELVPAQMMMCSPSLQSFA